MGEAVLLRQTHLENERTHFENKKTQKEYTHLS